MEPNIALEKASKVGREIYKLGLNPCDDIVSFWWLPRIMRKNTKAYSNKYNIYIFF